MNHLVNFSSLATILVTTIVGAGAFEKEDGMSGISVDICNLDLIYNDNFKYSLPRKFLEEYLCGKGFGNKDQYSPEEFKQLARILMIGMRR
ncbi:MAG: hypothetical protein L0207_02360 [Chlamydiae bacterium]|nr:hypothetical protein [Chlamydiota bacterium]